MRGLVIFLITLVVIASFSFVVVSINDSNNFIKTKQENKIVEFGTFTSAVCENKKDVVNCRDEVFVKCNGTITKAVDVAECNGFKVDVPKATGFATFGNDWKDPRI